MHADEFGEIEEGESDFVTPMVSRRGLLIGGGTGLAAVVLFSPVGGVGDVDPGLVASAAEKRRRGKEERLGRGSERIDRGGVSAEHYQLSIKPLKQSGRADCGRTCAAMVLRFAGYNLHPDDLGIPDNAHVDNELKPAFARNTNSQFRGLFWRSDAEDMVYDLEYETDYIGLPMIVLIAKGSALSSRLKFDTGHYVVVRGTSPGWIHCADPFDGKLYRTTNKIFKQGWGSTSKTTKNPWQSLYFRYR